VGDRVSDAFRPLGIAILTVSDTRSAADDRSGALLAELVTAAGHTIAERAIAKDDRVAIEQMLRTLLDDDRVEVVLATGGTGITGRDVTPEAFEAVYEKAIPGFGELFRWLSFQKIGAATIQSRATAGVANGTLLFALPGSPSACRDAWEGILEAQLDARTKPCNFAELLPRLRER
jgi:molybdenum cofactor biosynthesis protein B